MSYDWLPLDSFSADNITPEVKGIYFDTRNFYNITRTVLDMEDGLVFKPENIIKIEEIEAFFYKIKDVRTQADTIVLRFDNIGLTYAKWLKYIRLVRISDNCFVVCDRDFIPIIWRNCIIENIIL